MQLTDATPVIPVFLINLKRSPERLAAMNVRCQRQGIAFTRIEAIDGRCDALPGWLAGQFDGTQLSPGEVGCYASHLLAMGALLNGDAPACVVLEDDVILAPDFMQTVREAISAAPKGWDIIHLSTNFKSAVSRVARLPRNSSIVAYTRLPTGAGAYIINRAGAQKLLKPQQRTRPIDMEFRYGWVHDLTLYGVKPAPADQESGALTVSTIEARGTPQRSRWNPGILSCVYGFLLSRYRLGVVGNVTTMFTPPVRRGRNKMNVALVLHKTEGK